MLSVTVSQSRFTPEAVEVLLASRRLEQATNEHGVLYAEAMDPANQFRFKAVHRTDWSAEAVRRAQSLHRAENPDADLSSLRWGVEKITPSRK